MDPSTVIAALTAPDNGVRVGAVIVLLVWLVGRGDPAMTIRQRLWLRAQYIGKELARVVPITAPLAASILIFNGGEAWGLALTTFITSTLTAAGLIPPKTPKEESKQ